MQTNKKYADVCHETTFVTIFTQSCWSTVVISLWFIYSFASNIRWCISCSFAHVLGLKVCSVGVIRMCKALVTACQYCVKLACIIVITGYHNLKAAVRELVDFTQEKFGQWLTSLLSQCALATSAIRRWEPILSSCCCLLFVISYKWLVNHWLICHYVASFELGYQLVGLWCLCFCPFISWPADI